MDAVQGILNQNPETYEIQDAADSEPRKKHFFDLSHLLKPFSAAEASVAPWMSMTRASSGS